MNFIHDSIFTAFFPFNFIGYGIDVFIAFHSIRLMNNGAQNTFLLNQNDKSRKNVEKNFESGGKKRKFI